MNTFYLVTKCNGPGGSLLSLALVSSDGDFWYEAKLISKQVLDPWVAENVIPVLGREPILRYLFRKSFKQFVMSFANPEIICGSHQDIVHFCKLLESKDHNRSFNFAFSAKMLKIPARELISKIPHNALADATALMNWHLGTQEKMVG